MGGMEAYDMYEIFLLYVNTFIYNLISKLSKVCQLNASGETVAQMATSYNVSDHTPHNGEQASLHKAL